MRSRFFIWTLLLVLCSMPLGTKSAEPGKVISRFPSPSKKLYIELRGEEGTPTEVWIAPSSNRNDRKKLYADEAGLRVTATASTDDRMIVVSWGGASAGRHLEVFLRSKTGLYQHQKVDVSDLAWRELKRAQRLPKDAEPAHQYSALISVQSEPLSFVFVMDGDYIGQGQKPFDEMQLRYFVDTKSVKVFPKSSGTKR